MTEKETTLYTKIKKFIYNHRFALTAFLLPVLIMFIAFWRVGFYPAGDRAIPTIDMYHQYLPFHAELQHKLRNGESLFYSWNGGGGYNFWATMAYYCASPLNLLLFLFPERLINEGIELVLTIKVGLASLFMYIFLKKTYAEEEKTSGLEKRNLALARVGFSCFYALSAYTLAYYWCTMWIDSVALLPLCILGLYKLVDEDKPILYCISLALAVFCNYYIGYMICVFIAFYYLYVWFRKPREGGDLKFLADTAKTIMYSALGIGLSAFLFIPTVLAQKEAYYNGEDIPDDWGLRNSLLGVINQLFPNAKLSDYSGPPNVSTGLIIIILFIAYFTIRSISFRQKLGNALLMALMIASLCLNKLDFIWHGFHFPNSLTSRYAFIVAFLMVGLAYQTFVHIKELELNALYKIFLGCIAYYALAEKIMESEISNKVRFLYVGMLFLIAYTAIITAYKKTVIGMKALSFLLIFVIAAELTLSTSWALAVRSGTDRNPIVDKQESLRNILAEEGEGFSRTESLGAMGPIDAASLYHYKGVSMFSSALNADNSYFMRKIGIASNPAGNAYIYRNTNPVINAILNVGYLISDNKDMHNAFFGKKAENEMFALYENVYPTSMGYVLPESILSWDIENMGYPDQVLNDYVRAATNGAVQKVFDRIDVNDSWGEGFELTTREDGGLRTTSPELRGGYYTLQYNIQEPGYYYAFAEAQYTNKMSVIKADGSTVELRNLFSGIESVGRIDEPTQLRIRLDYDECYGSDIDCFILKLDMQAWEKAYEIISQDAMQVTEYGANYIKGKINASKEGILTTGVMNEKGWRLYVDGKRRNSDTIAGNKLISTDVQAGEHTIELKYIPYGFYEGLIVSLASLFLLLYGHSDLIERLRYKIKQARKNYAQEIETKRESKKII